jgi:hypothetical protein
MSPLKAFFADSKTLNRFSIVAPEDALTTAPSKVARWMRPFGRKNLIPKVPGALSHFAG